MNQIIDQHPTDAEDDTTDLLEKLTEDSGSPANASVLLPMIARLHRSAHSEPSADPVKYAATMRLAVTALRANSARRTGWGSAAGKVRATAAYFVALLRSQIRIVQADLWIASTLVMALGIVVTLMSTQANPTGGEIPFVLLAPAVAAVGVAFLYSTDADAMMEIERATPTSPQMLLLLRLALVFGFNLVLGLACSVILTIANPAYSLYPLIMAWLAPMAFLSALAFLLSVVFSDAAVGAVVGLAIWTVQVLNRFLAHSGYALAIPFPDMLSAQFRLWLLFLSVPLVIAALWLAGRDSSTNRRTR
jgi:hypothetical protein